ncbi:uncharacterized protein TNCV_4639921 [Trichonephila clavipes]|nr:uncharacterized protein TNCV_4639921 [Trichonephila clavipes]
MSLCGKEFQACCTYCVNIGTVSAGCGRCWSCHPMISHSCSSGDRSGDLSNQGNMVTLCRARCVTTVVLSYQTDVQICSQCVWDNHESARAVTAYCSPGLGLVCLGQRQFDFRRSSGLLLTMTGTKAELVFIRKHKRSTLRPPLSSGLTPLASQVAMAWSQWNTRYRVHGSELCLKQPISSSSLRHCGTNCSSTFCRRRTRI